jgi:hypothetical protein
VATLLVAPVEKWLLKGGQLSAPVLPKFKILIVEIF